MPPHRGERKKSMINGKLADSCWGLTLVGVVTSFHFCTSSSSHTIISTKIGCEWRDGRREGLLRWRLELFLGVGLPVWVRKMGELHLRNHFFFSFSSNFFWMFLYSLFFVLLPCNVKWCVATATNCYIFFFSPAVPCSPVVVLLELRRGSATKAWIDEWALKETLGRRNG